ncbi:MAG: hypothetical protein P4L85_14180 [Paludisphaera borealis]|uniref:hypothetical protein n=1 Tax=Paludisphaera borealis TaxID=1387353 RepID=UPI002850ECA7|nr:hypothetical protein [Paludisphaera borealis]MDR3620494.1 hypothetical protein [Paludisphaera borealis]
MAQYDFMKPYGDSQCLRYTAEAGSLAQAFDDFINRHAWHWSDGREIAVWCEGWLVARIVSVHNEDGPRQAYLQRLVPTLVMGALPCIGTSFSFPPGKFK